MRRTRLSAFLGVSLCVAIGLAAGCGDPVHDAEVTALGPEAANVSPGPLHRPGQPCLTCHGGEGPASETFVTAGTVYVYAYPTPATAENELQGGTVHLVDANNTVVDALTNTAGNFYVTPDQWSPTFPIGALSQQHTAEMSGACIPAFQGEIGVTRVLGAACASLPMASAIERGGVYASCAYCHFDPPSGRSPGHIYLSSMQPGAAP